MLSTEILLLALTSASIGIVHTVVGPDHYVPFIAIAKARNWKNSKTLLVTILCGIGHVLSSIIIGAIGIAFGIALFSLEAVEEFRGNIAGYLLIGFGLLYTFWGIKHAIRNKPHTHIHSHENGEIHLHEHTHQKEHAHPHLEDKNRITPWVLFVIFLFGPCEPLIPLLMYPAAQHSYTGVAFVSLIFAIATISTMVGMVFLGLMGVRLFPTEKFEKHIHTIAGLAILICGIAIQFLGL